MNISEEAPPIPEPGRPEPKPRRGAAFLRHLIGLPKGWLSKGGPVGKTLEVQARTPEDSGSQRALDPLQKSFALLHTQQDGLAELGKLVEAQFLTISAELERLPRASESLMHHSERLVVLAAGSSQEGSVLEKTMGLLRGPLSFVEEHHNTTIHLLSVVEKAGAQIERMLATEQALQRTVAPLKFIRTMYRVESAALDIAYQQMFQSLTEEIQNLQVQVNETFGLRFEGLRSNQSTIKQLIQRLQEENRIQGTHMKRKRQELDSAIQDLRTNLEAEKQKNVQLTDVTKVISKQIGSLVFSLQAQDVISQKVAHILEAFTDMNARFNTYQTAASAENSGAALQYLTQAVGVEAAQLKAVAENLNDTEGALVSSLDDVLQHIRGIQSDYKIPETTESEPTVEGDSNLVHVLLTSLSDVGSMVQTAATSAQAAYEAIKPIGGQASNVTETMRSLSAQIKLIALNAQIQAAHIQSGTGLEVLAAQTGLIASETGNISQEVGAELDTFSVHLNELVAAFSSLNERGVNLHAEWRQVASQKEAELRSYEKELGSERQCLAETAAQIESLSASMKSKVGLRKIAERWVATPAATLDEIHKILIRETGGAGLGSGSTSYKRAFTMESERHVHAQALSGGSSNSEGSSPQTERDSLINAKRQALVGTSDVTSELVLFDDFSASPEQQASATSQQDLAQAAASAEPVTPEASKGANPHQPTIAKSSEPKPLGDNVDLF